MLLVSSDDLLVFLDTFWGDFRRTICPYLQQFVEIVCLDTHLVNWQSCYCWIVSDCLNLRYIGG